MRTNLDLLNVQQRLFEAKRDLAEARYGYLLAYLRLRRAAGIVEFGSLHDIAELFLPMPATLSHNPYCRLRKQESLQQLE